MGQCGRPECPANIMERLLALRAAATAASKADAEPTTTAAQPGADTVEQVQGIVAKLMAVGEPRTTFTAAIGVTTEPDNLDEALEVAEAIAKVLGNETQSNVIRLGQMPGNRGIEGDETTTLILYVTIDISKTIYGNVGQRGNLESNLIGTMIRLLREETPDVEVTMELVPTLQAVMYAASGKFIVPDSFVY